MTSDFAVNFLPQIFVPLIGIMAPAVFIVLIGRYITASAE
ncbi:photosystem I reaction center subunit VIII [Prochlorococcus sp. MIT 1223]|nr:photosystem I reaction center subunit VIII [Prochlorococcus sp. MIT 1223]